MRQACSSSGARDIRASRARRHRQCRRQQRTTHCIARMARATAGRTQLSLVTIFLLLFVRVFFFCWILQTDFVLFVVVTEIDSTWPIYRSLHRIKQTNEWMKQTNRARTSITLHILLFLFIKLLFDSAKSQNNNRNNTKQQPRPIVGQKAYGVRSSVATRDAFSLSSRNTPINASPALKKVVF